MIDEREHWVNICKLVSAKCLNIFDDIRSNKLKSEIVSHLFETQTEKYFKSIGYNVSGAKNDHDPDLFCHTTNKPYEIKVTKVSGCVVNKCKWMGGKYSKRTSDYVLIMWNQHNTFFGEDISFNITKCFIDEGEWYSIDNGKENYYATNFKCDTILKKDYKVLIGNVINGKFLLEGFKNG